MLGLNDTPMANDKTVLDDIFQLSDISGKIILHQDVHDIGADADNLFALAGIVFFDEMIYQIWDVLPALLQCGQLEFHDGQSDVEIVTKFGLRHQFF